MNSRSKTGEKRHILRVAVLSDLHAYDRAALAKLGQAPSSLLVEAKEEPRDQHPFSSLFDIVKQEKPVNLVICGGDLGDRCNRDGIKYVWAKLHELKGHMKAQHLVVTTGNHDVDSRLVDNAFDPKDFLQGLSPRYPVDDEKLSDMYWGRNYYIIESRDYRLVNLNTCAFHGVSSDKSTIKEFDHGRISPTTLDRLSVDLRAAHAKKPKAINILVCHHHPHKHADVEDSDYSVMEGGEKLIKLLGGPDIGSWIIFHGHKHYATVCYGAGDFASPIIFAAGSFSAHIYLEAQGFSRNQFYILEFPIDEISKSDFGLFGTYKAWDWANGKGWRPAGEESGLKAKGGFGMPPFGLVEVIKEFLDKKGVVQWTDLEKEFGELKYLLVSDRSRLLSTLERKYGFVAIPSLTEPVQIGKPK
jgi:predicted MPP superfamily phosphohydrolase